MRAREASEAVRQAALVEGVVVLPALVGRLEVVHAPEGVVLAGREVLPDELPATDERNRIASNDVESHQVTSNETNRTKINETKRNETETKPKPKPNKRRGGTEDGG